MSKWSVVHTVTFLQDAYMIKSYLESAGIETLIPDEFTAQVNNFYTTAIGGVRLMVRTEDLESGVALLKEGGYINSENSETDEEILTFLFRSTFSLLCIFSIHFYSNQKDGGTPPFKASLLCRFLPLPKRKEAFPVCCSFFPLASFKLESLLFPEDAPNVQLVGQQVETLLPT